MNWDAIGAIGEILGALSVLITLIYLARQIHQNTEQARLGSIQAVNASNDSALESIYIPENSLIFTRGQQSYSDLSDHGKLIFDMLMARLIASFNATTYQYENGAYDEELYWGTTTFYSSFVTSVGGAQWLEKNKAPFSKSCIRNLESPTPNK